MNSSIIQNLAVELSIRAQQVASFIALYEQGNTVPFIARYRKEKTGGLDDKQLRLLETRLNYLSDLQSRRETILKSLTESGKLTCLLKKQIEQVNNKSDLELIYSPFKSKRISKAALAIEVGLEIFADKLWFSPDQNRTPLAEYFINKAKGFNNAEAVQEGGLAIMVERLSVDLKLLEKLRKQLFSSAFITSQVVLGKELQAVKFKDYFNYNEKLKLIVPHRFLAMLRGKELGFLKLKIKEDVKQCDCKRVIARHLGFSLNNISANSWRKEVIRKAWKTRLFALLETQLLNRLKEQANESAIDIFAHNLKDLLMAAPAGKKVILGVDPGFVSGCKIAVIDITGRLLDSATVYPHSSSIQRDHAVSTLLNFLKKYTVELIAIGNGTASRETDQFMAEILKQQKRVIRKLIISEAGASVYSASELGSLEFPDLDVSIRGAVSIARRLQDPLSELVKIDCKAIGVGLYQHSLNRIVLDKRLQTVVEDCVNAVGVDLNSASASLLSFIAGLNKTTAQNIITYRDKYGLFRSRESLKKVPRLGDKAFLQAAGFLRITDAKDRLDNSAVHPESYPLVNKIAVSQKVTVNELFDNEKILSSLNLHSFISSTFSLLAIQQIIEELQKPSRDPRPTFKTVCYAEGINKLSDLQLDMQLQGVISNVTSFGAFVDIGVHQDGLLHISQLAHKFVKDPHQVVKAGQIVTVKVIEIDLPRKRIALTMRQQS